MPAAGYMLGLDCGITNTKAVAFDADGREAATSVVASSELRHRLPGWSEHDLDAIWADVRRAISALWSQGIDPSRISAIGVAGQGNGLNLLDDDALPVGPGISSTDTRAASLVERWAREGVVRVVHALSMGYLLPGGPCALLAWLKENDPGTYARARHVVFVKDWVKYKITGVLCTDPTDAGVAGMLDPAAGRYEPRVFEALGIAESVEKMPALLPSWRICGAVTERAARETGLRVGTPVVSGAQDVNASVLGAGGTEAGQLTMILGTFGIDVLVLPQLPPGERTIGLFSTPHAVPERWLVSNGDPNSGSVLDWFVGQLGGKERQEAAERGVSVFDLFDPEVSRLEPTAGAIYCHPFLYGSPKQASARAGLVGIGAWHTTYDILRAVYEAVSFCHLQIVQALRDLGEIGKISAIGGGARSEVLSQMLADVTGLDIDVPRPAEFAARGAALAAGLGVGTFAAPRDVTPVTVARSHRPNPERSVRYRERYRLFARSVESLRTVWDEMARPAGGSP